MRIRRAAAGWTRQCYANSLFRIGLLKDYTSFSKACLSGRIVFICKGNIARSAYAAARARQLGFDDVGSAGLWACTGKPADLRAVEAAAERGVDLRSHRARHVSELALTEADNAFTFEVWQARTLSVKYGVTPLLLGAWARRPQPHIEDPYHYDASYYRTCFDVIDDALGRLAELREPVLYPVSLSRP